MLSSKTSMCVLLIWQTVRISLESFWPVGWNEGFGMQGSIHWLWEHQPFITYCYMGFYQNLHFNFVPRLSTKLMHVFPQVSWVHDLRDRCICQCSAWSNGCSFFLEIISERVCRQEASSMCCQSIRSIGLLPRHRCKAERPAGESCFCSWQPNTPSLWNDSPSAMS